MVSETVEIEACKIKVFPPAFWSITKDILSDKHKDNALYSMPLAKSDAGRHPSYRYKLSICYWGS